MGEEQDVELVSLTLWGSPPVLNFLGFHEKPRCWTHHLMLQNGDDMTFSSYHVKQRSVA